MSNVTPIHPKAAPPPPNDPLTSAASLLRAAVALYGDSHEPENAEMRDVDEVLGIAQSRLEAWLREVAQDADNHSAAFNALDGITVVRALIAADISPRNGITISPISAVLRLAARDLEAITGLPGDTEEDAS